MKVTKKQQPNRPIAAADAPTLVRQQLLAWWARTLNEIDWVEQELKDDEGVFGGVINPTLRSQLSLKLSQVWHEMSMTLHLAPPVEFGTEQGGQS